MRYERIIEMLESDRAGLERRIKGLEAEIRDHEATIESTRDLIKALDAQYGEYRDALFILKKCAEQESLVGYDPAGLDSVEKDTVKV